MKIAIEANSIRNVLISFLTNHEIVGDIALADLFIVDSVATAENALSKHETVKVAICLLQNSEQYKKARAVKELFADRVTILYSGECADFDPTKGDKLLFPFLREINETKEET